MGRKYIPIVFLVISIAACGSPSSLRFREGGQPQATPAAKPVPKTFDRSTSFGLMMETVIKPKCLSCHDAENKKGKIELTDYETIVKHPELVKAGEPAKSLLFTVLATNEMPPKEKELLPSAEKDIVYKWIAGGAKENERDGKSPGPAASPAPTPTPTPTPAPTAEPVPTLAPYIGGYPQQYSNPYYGQYTGYPATLPPAPAPVPEPVGFAVAREILQQNCVDCHGGRKKKAGLDFTTYENIMGMEGLIVPGNPDESALYQQVRDQQMPPDNPLKDELKEKLYQWIKDGAKN